MRQVEFNPYSEIFRYLDRRKKKCIEAFSLDEVNVIINAFASHPIFSYYQHFIEFRFLTGCRPSEAVALTWNDIITSYNRTSISFNKRYNAGELHHGTKNGMQQRIFPCNQQLQDLLARIPRIENDLNLIFVGKRLKSYINHDRFSVEVWKPMVSQLHVDGLISKYLSFYDQRHTFGTHITRSGIDLKTTSSIMGNSPSVLMKHYLATNEDVVLPELR